MLTRVTQRLATRLRLLPFPVNVHQLLARDAPGGLHPPDFRSANRHCRFYPARAGWVAINLARAEDREIVSALIGQEEEIESGLSEWSTPQPAQAVRDQLAELHLPAALAGEASPQALTERVPQYRPGRVIDMSALWAGPLCGALLTRAGFDVVRIDSVGRPDPTQSSSPLLHDFLSVGKKLLRVDLREPADQQKLLREIATADMLITSGRAAALKRLGLDPAVLFDCNPGLRWIAITAYGFTGDGAGRVGFGDDCAVAGGLMEWRDHRPRFIGDALADPLTGVEAAIAALSAREGELIDMAMACVAAAYRKMAEP